jgi:magnesium-transporting ATPase (P-type)
MASDGLRTICIAYKDYVPAGAKREDSQTLFGSDDINWEDEDGVISNLVALSILGIQDPVRPEVPDAIIKCQVFVLNSSYVLKHLNL